MEAVIINRIPFRPEPEKLADFLHVSREGEDFEAIKRLAEQAGKIAVPKALYKPAFVDSRTDDSVVIEGIEFKSRVLRVNLEKAHRVFPFAATCGMELEDWSRSQTDGLAKIWTEAIKGMALGAALAALNNDVSVSYKPGKTSVMNPGSLQDWPIEQQKPLFKLLKDVREATGIELRDNLLMIPSMSVSGIMFPTEESFESCQLCPRESCPGRRAPYDKDLYAKKYSNSV